MGALFKLPSSTRSSREGDSALLAKTKRSAALPPRVLKGKDSLMDRIKMVKALVESKLGKYEPDVECIRDIYVLESYIDEIIKNKIAGIDTETTGLDTLKDIIVGGCLYTPGQKAAYVPIEHVSYVTGVRVEGQIPREQVIRQFKRLQDEKVDLLYHNAKYDWKMFHNDWGLDMPIYWDTQVGSFMLNENISHRLKDLWAMWVCKGEDPETGVNFDELFKDLDFRYVPIATAGLYAAMDAKKTFELFEFEENLLCTDMPGCKEKHLEGVSWVFHKIETPVSKVLANMENRGIAIDREYAESLSAEYEQKLKLAEDDFYKTLEIYRDEITAYKRKHPGGKFKEPVQIGSPQQIGILLYEVLGLGDISWGTGEGVLESLDHPLAQKILDYREVQKLLSTYIRKLPKVCHERTGKIHCQFNQNGAATGRLSSSDPNLQNIPSKDKNIRKMFIPDPGYVLVGSDFSQQEPRLLAHMSQDPKLIEAYVEGKDLYATVGSFCYRVPYEACLEHHPDGTKNPEGTKRRNSMKTVVLGMMYGRGAKAIADQLHISLQEGKKIVELFQKAFPRVQKWIDETHAFVKKYGWVEDAFGRKRRLTDAQLPDYTLELTGKASTKNFDPLAMLSGKAKVQTTIDPKTEKMLLEELRGAYGFKAVNDVKKKALSMGIKVHDNTGKISEALRQAVNFRIQGSAASQTKLAMSQLENDKEWQEAGGQLLLQVHDELIAQAPIETAKKAGERMSYIMRHCGDGILSVPFKCDVEYTDRWYGEEVEV